MILNWKVGATNNPKPHNCMTNAVKARVEICEQKFRIKRAENKKMRALKHTYEIIIPVF